jgi:hypothetical protein
MLTLIIRPPRCYALKSPTYHHQQVGAAPSKFTWFMLGSLVLLLVAVSVVPKQGETSETELKASSQAPQATAAVQSSPISTAQATPEMQFKWGLQYSKGEGVAKDDRSAVAWWIKSAEGGHVKAQVNLACDARCVISQLLVSQSGRAK